jgi:toxin ParE1/3/4
VKYRVNLTSSAEDDLFEIFKYIYFNDSPEIADNVYSGLKEKCFSLHEFPERGHVPRELSLFGISDFQEINYNSYRIVYQIIGKDIFIHCVLDSRRDLQKLLLERLTR